MVNQLTKKGGAFASLRQQPAKDEVCFLTQDETEPLYYMVRASRATMIFWVGRYFLYSLLFFLFYFFLLGQTVLNISIGVFLLLFLLYIVVSYGYLLGNFVRWYYSLYIITDRRILDYDFSVFSGFRVSETSLEKIEDVTESRVGLFPNLFNYGDLMIQTAGASHQFYLEDISNPSFIRDKIVDLAELYKHSLEK